MKTRVIKSYPYRLTGFPVVLENVELSMTGEQEFPVLDYDELNRRILVALATKQTRLTGNQVRYIRHSFELSLRDFAKLFRFSATSVHKWEQRENRATSMEWPAELLLRTEVLLRYAGNEAAITNWENLKNSTLPHEPGDACLRMAARPASLPSRKTVHVSGGFVRTKPCNDQALVSTSSQTTVKATLGAGMQPYDRSANNLENAADAFADAA